MSQAMLDKKSWSNAMGPTIRVIGYVAAIYLVIYIGIFLPISILVNNFGFPGFVFEIILALTPIALLFFFVLSLFKVLDEELSAR